MLSPNRFVELVTLGLYWELQKIGDLTKTITVGPVLNAFTEIGLVSDVEAIIIRHGTNGAAYQRALYNRCKIVQEGASSGISNGYWFSCKQNHTVNHALYLRGLVIDKQLRFLPAGLEKAQGLELAFVDDIQKGMYLEASTEITRRSVKM